MRVLLIFQIFVGVRLISIFSFHIFHILRMSFSLIPLPRPIPCEDDYLVEALNSNLHISAYLWRLRYIFPHLMKILVGSTWNFAGASSLLHEGFHKYSIMVRVCLFSCIFMKSKLEPSSPSPIFSRTFYGFLKQIMGCHNVKFPWLRTPGAPTLLGSVQFG